jgi:Ribbon-helix-helix protein, copG family
MPCPATGRSTDVLHVRLPRAEAEEFRHLARRSGQPVNQLLRAAANRLVAEAA